MKGRLHKSKAKRNLEYYEEQRERIVGYEEWRVVSLFYAALHYLDRYLHSVGYDNITSHRVRARIAGKLLDEKTWESYKTLYDFSRDARYSQLHMEYLTEENFEELEQHVEIVASLPLHERPG